MPAGFDHEIALPVLSGIGLALIPIGRTVRTFGLKPARPSRTVLSSCRISHRADRILCGKSVRIGRKPNHRRTSAPLRLLPTTIDTPEIELVADYRRPAMVDR